VGLCEGEERVGIVGYRGDGLLEQRFAAGGLAGGDQGHAGVAAQHPVFGPHGDRGLVALDEVGGRFGALEKQRSGPVHRAVAGEARLVVSLGGEGRLGEACEKFAYDEPLLVDRVGKALADGGDVGPGGRGRLGGDEAAAAQILLDRAAEFAGEKVGAADVEVDVLVEELVASHAAGRVGVGGRGEVDHLHSIARSIRKGADDGVELRVGAEAECVEVEGALEVGAALCRISGFELGATEEECGLRMAVVDGGGLGEATGGGAAITGAEGCETGIECGLPFRQRAGVEV